MSAILLWAGLLVLGVAAARGPLAPRAAHAAAEPQPFLPQLASLIRAVDRVQAHQVRAHVRAVRRRHDPKPRTKSSATISLYERTTKQFVFRVQGCRAAKRGATGVVVLDFGKPAYSGHAYGTILFSGAFAGNHDITRAMLGYAVGYARCLPRGSDDQIALARGTSNYHPSVPNVYRAGRRWARETMALQHMLRAHDLDEHVISAAADDVEPAWDPSFWRTRDFYRGYADSRIGHALYNYGSLDGGIVTGYWNVHQAFFVTGGMRYARAIPEIYNQAMAREWAALAQAAKHRYHRPVRFAGVMTERTAGNHGVKPKDAHRMLVRELAVQGRGHAAAARVPAAYTNIRSNSN
ncbi:MAG: hypothetical protein ACRDL2_08410 [Gaiellaceae bacterium]